MVQKIRKSVLFLLFVCMAVATQAQKNARYHTVEEGQTLYSIARLYNITPNELQKLNPEAGDFIRPGDKLRLPNNAKEQPVAVGPGAQFVGTGGQTGSAQPAQGKCKEMYQIQKKDNLYRIALEHHITVEELVSANPGITAESKLKKGNWLCIPFSKAELQAEADRLAAERAKAEAQAKKTSKSHLNVAVILPLKENTDRGGKMIEFYQGMLMAVDSVRKQGTSIDIYAYHSGNSVAELNSILEKEEMKKMDVLFGPLDGVQANILNNYSQQHKIPLVMPFATTNTYAGRNPHAYVVSAQMDVVNKNAAASVTQKFKGYNVVVINTGAGDNRGNAFVNQLTQQMEQKGDSPRKIDLNADEFTYSSTFSLTRNNLVVLNTSSQNALQKSIKAIRTFMSNHPDYKISLLGYPEWSTFQGSIVQDFYALDTYIFSSFFRNPNDVRVQGFERRFKANFHHDLIKTAPRYGLMGLDLGYYFLNGMSRLGDYFDERQQNLSYSPLQNAFRFTRENEDRPFINTSVSLIHYHPIGRIEVVK